MTQPRDPDAIVAAWLEDGPVRLPHETRSAIVVALRTQPRVRRTALPGGIMHPLNRFATAAAVVLAVGVVGVLLFSNRTSDVGTAPTVAPSSSPAAVAPSPSSAAVPSSAPSGAPSAAPSAQAVVSTADWLPFSSTRYGYDVKYPPYLSPSQSTHQWTTADEADWLSAGHDLFKGQVAITVFAIQLPAGVTRDSWIASNLSGPVASSDPQACTHTQVALPTSAVDRLPVVFWRESENADCGGTYAFVANGNRLYAFFIGLPGYEPTLEAFLSTLTFRG